MVYRTVVNKMNQPIPKPPVKVKGYSTGDLWEINTKEEFEANRIEEYKHLHTKDFRDYCGNNALVYDIANDDEQQLEKDLLKLNPNEENVFGISAAQYALLFGSKLFPLLGVSEKDIHDSIASKLVDVRTDNIFTEVRPWLITIQRNSSDYYSFLAKAFSEEEDTIEYLSKNQISVIHDLYQKHNLYHENDNYGGHFGVYFQLKVCTLEKLLSKGFDPFKANYSIYVYDARTLLSKICQDITTNNINTKNMIYFNRGWNYGTIDDRTIIMKTLSKRNLEKTIVETVNEFLDFPKIMNIPFSNEVVIKWILPVHSSYGLICQNREFSIIVETLNMYC